MRDFRIILNHRLICTVINTLFNRVLIVDLLEFFMELCSVTALHTMDWPESLFQLRGSLYNYRLEHLGILPLNLRAGGCGVQPIGHVGVEGNVVSRVPVCCLVHVAEVGQDAVDYWNYFFACEVIIT